MIQNNIINKKNILKCIFIGLYLTIEGLVLQVSKARLFLQKKPPASEFIIGVTILYFITGFLFALGYFIIKDAIPGRNRITKGLVYSLLIVFSMVFGSIIGVIGLDFAGKFNLLTPFKIESYAVTLTDMINFTITGMVLGLIAEKKDIIPVKYQFNKKKIFITSITGFFIFPILLFFNL